MWPFDYIRKRKYNRRYKAALLVFLGAYLIEKLDANQKAIVEREMDKNLNKTDTPVVAERRWDSWDFLAISRAAAMERVGIELPVPKLSWSELFAPWARWQLWPQWPFARDYDCRPDFVGLDFRLMHPATAEAEAFLLSYGIGKQGGVAREATKKCYCLTLRSNTDAPESGAPLN